MKHFDLKISYYSGILYLISFLPLFSFEILRMTNDLPAIKFAHAFVVIASSAVFLPFIYGFYIIGRKENLSFLVSASLAMALFTVVSAGYSIALLYSDVVALNEPLMLFILTVSGALEAIFSYSLFGLKKKFSRASGTAVLGLLMGISMTSVIFYFIAVLLIIPVYWGRIRLLEDIKSSYSKRSSRKA